MTVSSKETLILLDAHAILHRAFHALPNFTSPKGEPTGAIYGFASMVLKIMKELKPDYLAACYDLPEPTFRHIVYKKYKAQRPKMADELVSQIESSRKILQTFGVKIFEATGFEADDVLASIVETLKKNGPKNLNIIIVTGDLDTLQLVGGNVSVYTMKKGIQEAILYNEKAVKERYGFSPELLPDFKGLKGDASDNIIGVKGIGEKTAQTLIEAFGSLENIYQKLKENSAVFEKIGIKPRVTKLLEENEEEAFFSKMLAKTRTDAPVSFSLKEARWLPSFDKSKAEELFRSFGFRSLFSRLPAGEAGLPENPKSGFGEILKPDFEAEKNPELVKELKVAFWLLDSRRVNPELSEILAFAKTEDTAAAKKILEEEMKKDGLFRLFNEIELPLIKVLSQMEKRGMLLDTGYLKKLSKDYHSRLKETESKIWQMAGEKFNINSPKQMAEVLFKKMNIRPAGIRRTATGGFSTRFSELEKIKDRHPIVNEIFSFRELAKLVSTYADTLPALADSENRLHTSYNQTGTATGRLSSSEPNLQNIPVRTDFGRGVRKAFIAPQGWSLVSFDYSQVELRIAAFLSGDEKLLTAFRRGEDIHNRVAAEVFNVPIESVDAEMRRRAKVINFGIIYGMGVNSLRKNLNCAREEAEIFYSEYFNDFSGMRRYINDIKDETSQKGFTSTVFGRRRYLPEINSSLEFIRKEAERMAVNAPIQGAAADVIKLAMVKIEEMLQNKGFSNNAKMILQVHDELLFEIKDDIIKKLTPLVKNIMEQSFKKAAIRVDVSTGRNWSEMKRF